MLIELWEYSLYVGLIKVTCNYVNIVRVDPLLFVNGVQQDRERRVYVGIGWNVHSRDDHYC